MKLKKLKSLILIIFFCDSNLVYSSISIVYNLRIAETTKRSFNDPFYKKPSLLTITLFDEPRKKRDGTSENIGGGLASLIYFPQPYYLRVDFAAARVSSKLDSMKFCRTQTDDLLFSAGYAKKINEKTRLTFSGFLGIPTHADLSLQGIQFGFAHVGLGGQIDGAFTLRNKNNSIRAATRLIHFFPRTLTNQDNNEIEKFRFKLGNLADVLIGFHHVFGRHSLEVGYDQSFWFGAKIKPKLADLVKKTNYIRTSFYASYKYKFLFYSHASAFTLATSYGFDIRPRKFGHKRINVIWGSWEINF